MVEEQTFNLFQVVKALEGNSIQIALDVGVHGNCQINSNCPIAVELRKIIKDTGVDLAQLLEGYAVTMAQPQPAIEYALPPIDGKVEIKVGGYPVPIDLTELFNKEVSQRWKRKMTEVASRDSVVARVAKSLHEQYTSRVRELDSARTLPALNFSAAEVIDAGCSVTASRGSYLFIFPILYEPHWIVNSGCRYEIIEDDIKAISTKAYVKISITRDRKITEIKLLSDIGYGLEHYHGRESSDCWGFVKIPETWDGRLESLKTLVRQLVGALATVNYNSLIQHDPVDMPGIGGVLSRSKKLGEEGVMGDRESIGGGRWGVPDRDTTGAEEIPDPIAPLTPRRWGERGEVAAGGTTVIRDELVMGDTHRGTVAPEDAMEHGYWLRWGVRNYQDVPPGAPCAMCGEIWERHHDHSCPDDGAHLHSEEEMEYFRRWGVYSFGEADELEAHGGAICALCNNSFASHTNYRCPTVGDLEV